MSKTTYYVGEIHGDIYRTDRPDTFASTAFHCWSRDEVTANAELIMRALNCHDDLLESCKRLIDVIEQLIPEKSARGVADVVLFYARDVIAKATP